jgi:hypothetical protein
MASLWRTLVCQPRLRCCRTKHNRARQGIPKPMRSTPTSARTMSPVFKTRMDLINWNHWSSSIGTGGRHHVVREWT